MQSCLLLILFVGLLSLPAAGEDEIDLIPKPLLQMGSGIYYSKFAFVVDKKKRQLSLWESTEHGRLIRVKQYDADMGKTKGDKLLDGDHKTPEGVYFLEKMLQGEKIPFELYGSRAFTTNYPNFFDSRAGKTGSGIWLHAVPDSTPLTRGSRGCVVIRNEAILEAESYFTPNTPIVIEESVELVSRETVLQENNNIQNFLKGWLKSWESGSIDEYIDHYHAEFRGKRMNKKGWKRYKARLKRKHSKVEIEISKPMVFFSGKELTIRFIQSYKSDSLSDFGEKTLYVLKQGGDLNPNYRIFGETWKSSNGELARTEWSDRPFVSKDRPNTPTAQNHQIQSPNPNQNSEH